MAVKTTKNLHKMFSLVSVADCHSLILVLFASAYPFIVLEQMAAFVGVCVWIFALLLF